MPGFTSRSDTHTAPTIAAVLLAGVLPVGIALAIRIAPGRTYVNEPLHALAEIAGGSMALAVALLLELRVRHTPYAPERARLVWLASALVGMGTMDVVHGALPVGTAWSWSRHIATLEGGLLFALVCVPGSPALWAASRYVVAAIAAATSGVALFTAQFAESLPLPWTAAGYTLGPKIVNALGGVGCLIAAAFLLREFHRHGRRDDLVFAAHTLLFGVAGVLFPMSRLWGGGWWLWHVLRGVGYLVVVVAAYATVNAMYGGLVRQTLNLGQDVEQRTRELKDAEQQLRMALDAAQMGVFEVDPATGEVRCDAQVRRTFALPAAVRVSLGDVLDRIHPGDLPRVRQALDHALDPRSGGAYKAEYRVPWPDGSIRWVAAAGQAYFAGGGARRHSSIMIGIAADITDRRRAEADREELLAREQFLRREAEAANHMKEEFLAIASHELRTPLNAMLGWADILRRSEDVPPHRLRRALDVIYENGRRQAALIDDLLDMSRIVAGKTRLAMSNMQLAAVLDAAVDIVRPTAQSKGVTLHVVSEGSSDPYWGDVDRVQQILWNLLSNAVKFTAAGGHVTVAHQRVIDGFEIRVSDTGSGIAPSFLPYIFDPFRQADSSPTRRHGGLGLGLAITRRLVEMHGGTIEAQSDGAGSGATFIVRLPSTPAAATMTGGRTDGSCAGTEPGRFAQLDGIRVLLVDDDRDSLEMMATALGDRGAAVRAVGTAADAWHALQERPSDVIVADIGMPVEDGYSFIRKVRAGPDAIREIPAIAVTAYVTDRDQALARDAGFQAHVAKPIDAAAFTDTVRRVCSTAAGSSVV